MVVRRSLFHEWAGGQAGASNAARQKLKSIWCARATKVSPQ